jgi:hypothetical protein
MTYTPGSRQWPQKSYSTTAVAGQMLSEWQYSVEVEVTLWPMVSWPVRLGVLPLLEQVTRCYIYLSDNYFLYFSCGAPSLMSGRVRNLQCNDASSITTSYIATDGLPASSSWCRAPSEAHNQILISLFDSYFVAIARQQISHAYSSWRVNDVFCQVHAKRL